MSVGVPVEPDHDLLEHYRTKDALARSFITSYFVSRRAMLVSAESLREYLSSSTNLTDKDLDGLVAALEDRSVQEAACITDEELARELSAISLVVQRRIQRKKHAASKEKILRARSTSPRSVLKDRQRQLRHLFAGEKLTSAVGALLVGKPDLVDRAVRAVKHMALTNPERKYRVLRCEDTESAATWVKEADGEVRAVTFFVPWWDSIYSNIAHFRSMVSQAEEQMKAPADYMIFDDLGRRPKGMDGLKDVPKNYLSRAAKVYGTLDSLVRRRGAVLVAGFKLREGESYDHREMAKLSEKCRKYDLYEEHGLLYATDSFGTNHLIVEQPSE